MRERADWAVKIVEETNQASYERRTFATEKPNTKNSLNPKKEQKIVIKKGCLGFKQPITDLLIKKNLNIEFHDMSKR